MSALTPIIHSMLTFIHLNSKATRTLENLAAGDIELTKAELDEIAAIMAKYEVKGDRYLGGAADKVLHLWG